MKKPPNNKIPTVAVAHEDTVPSTYDERQKAHRKRRAIAAYGYQRLATPEGLASKFPSTWKEHGRPTPKMRKRITKRIRRAIRKKRSVLYLSPDLRRFVLEETHAYPSVVRKVDA